MPVTKFQREIALLLAVNRTPDSHLAGGAALHFEPNSKRYSNDLDYFHDSVERVTEAFAADRDLLRSNGYMITVEMTQPGYIRARVEKKTEGTKIEWAHDSAWRFMPAEENPDSGYRLHPVDLSVNKVLALVGRDEPRDFLDILYILAEILPLGALCWAASGKDPGFTPLSLLELLKRRGRYREDDFSKLQLTYKVDLKAMKLQWLSALEEAENFIRERPADQIGCLYYSKVQKRFVAPQARAGIDNDILLHFGRPGGIIPKLESSDAVELKK